MPVRLISINPLGLPVKRMFMPTIILFICLPSQSLPRDATNRYATIACSSHESYSG